jgi:hypothetical protein
VNGGESRRVIWFCHWKKEKGIKKGRELERAIIGPRNKK